MPESSTLRVEIADAGGTVVELPHRIAEVLRALGLEAVVVPPESIVSTTSADAVVLRGDAPGVLGILRSLRDDGARPDTPVLLLGTPEGTGPFQEGPGFGAEHVLPKDASAERIAEVLRRIAHKKKTSLDASRERRVEHTLELGQRGEHAAGEWRTQSGDQKLSSDPPGVVRREERQVSEVIVAPELSQVLDTPEASRRPASQPGDRRNDSVVPGSHPGTGSGVLPGTGSVPSTSQLFVVASISDELRKLLYDADRRIFPERAPIDVSLPRGEDAARELVPDDFVEAISIALDEPERADLELTFVGAVRDDSRARAPSTEGVTAARPELADPAKADDDENRPKTSPGTPTSMSRRPPEPAEGSTRSTADPQLAPARPHLGEAPVMREDVVRPSQPPPRVALVSSERGELAPLGALAMLGQLALGRLDVVLTLRVEDRPCMLTLVRGELVSVAGEGWSELRRRALHRVLSSSVGASQATELSRGEPTFVLERAGRLADEAALVAILLEARGPFALEPRAVDAREPGPRLTQRTLAASLFELGRRGLGTDRVLSFYLPGPEDPMVSRLERLARLEVARVPALERVLDAVEAPRELAWLLRRETATSATTLASLVTHAPDEPGLVGAVFALAQLGALSLTVLPQSGSLAHTDLDARAEKAIAALRERADRADYFDVLGIARDADGSAVVEAHYRLRTELLAWPLADLGLARLEADRMRILAALDDAADVLADARLRRRYARGLASS